MVDCGGALLLHMVGCGGVLMHIVGYGGVLLHIVACGGLCCIWLPAVA
jgi:hypothetical protein